MHDRPTETFARFSPPSCLQSKLWANLPQQLHPAKACMAYVSNRLPNELTTSRKNFSSSAVRHGFRKRMSLFTCPQHILLLAYLPQSIIYHTLLYTRSKGVWIAHIQESNRACHINIASIASIASHRCCLCWPMIRFIVPQDFWLCLLQKRLCNYV